MDLFDSLIDEILRNNEIHRSFLTNSLRQLTEEEKQTLSNYISFFIKDGKSIPYIAECYNTMVKDTVTEQIFFLKNKKYRYSRFSEVESTVYLNDDYMEKYMIGLGVSSFLWPQHLKIHRFFLDKMPSNNPGTYLEIGPGHGFYFMDAMKKTKYSFFEGIDISPKSISMTNGIIDSGLFGKFDNYSVYQADFIQFNPGKTYDAIVMGEVLEHVENPSFFLEKIYSIANKDSFIYITTVINAPAVDHIYLFDSPDSLKELILKAKLSVKEMLLAPANENMSVEKHLEKKLPIVVALILLKS
jgi:2-polyprenyl-3-methyl-5-hydroxy-6-metoxy-1,4-benzoquinol methylase